ncbi:hypothetical protein KCP74_16405 [Salmonella enterica subsp. enterica]|nr:hypothetical protein KCP74_16405 [Salmonella enterica subsp. enterica]
MVYSISSPGKAADASGTNKARTGYSPTSMHRRSSPPPEDGQRMPSPLAEHKESWYHPRKTVVPRLSCRHSARSVCAPHPYCAPYALKITLFLNHCARRCGEIKEERC